MLKEWEPLKGMKDPDRSAGERLVKSKRRVEEHGEVFTPEWAVIAMLDLVKAESERIDSRFLEPACGSGNFLVEVLRRKLAAIEVKYSRNDFERAHFAIYALMSIYGVELLSDNIVECRDNMLEILADFLNVDASDDLYLVGWYVITQNVIHGDALSMRTNDGSSIVFAEWGYLGKGKFQRRDFRLDALTQSAAFSVEGTLFSQLGRHEIFVPIKTYSPMSVGELAELGRSAALATTRGDGE